MKEHPHIHMPHLDLHVGTQNLRTAIAATLCALLYLPLERNPTFACIGAIFGTGSDMENSRLNGGNRLIGTAIGGVLGMVLFRLYTLLYPDGSTHWPILVFLFLGVVLLVTFSRLFHWRGAVQPGGVVLCIILFNTPVDEYISYSLDRILDTGIGVLLALGLNIVLPRERMARLMEKLHLRSKQEEKI